MCTTESFSIPGVDEALRHNSGVARESFKSALVDCEIASWIKNTTDPLFCVHDEKQNKIQTHILLHHLTLTRQYFSFHVSFVDSTYNEEIKIVLVPYLLL